MHVMSNATGFEERLLCQVKLCVVGQQFKGVKQQITETQLPKGVHYLTCRLWTKSLRVMKQIRGLFFNFPFFFCDGEFLEMMIASPWASCFTGHVH